MAFITDSSASYWERRCYQERYPSAAMPAYDDLSPRYAEADRVYGAAYSEMVRTLAERG